MLLTVPGDSYLRHVRLADELLPWHWLTSEAKEYIVMRKARVGMSAGLLTVALVAGAWSARKSSAAPFVLDVVKPERGDLVAAVTATGSLQPRRTVDCQK